MLLNSCYCAEFHEIRNRALKYICIFSWKLEKSLWWLSCSLNHKASANHLSTFYCVSLWHRALPRFLYTWLSKVVSFWRKNSNILQKHFLPDVINWKCPGVLPVLPNFKWNLTFSHLKNLYVFLWWGLCLSLASLLTFNLHLCEKFCSNAK